MTNYNDTTRRTGNGIAFIAVFVLMFSALGAIAQTTTGDRPTSGTTIENRASSPDQQPGSGVKSDLRERLGSLANQLRTRRAELNAIRIEIAALPKGTESPELKEREQQALTSVNKLSDAFEQIATNGIDLPVPNDAQAKPYNWQDELVAIVKPVLGGLKELTEKPRKIEELRNRIEGLQTQIRVADDALGALGRFRPDELDKTAAENLELLRKDWVDRRNDVYSDLEKTRIQLANLDNKDFSYSNAITKQLNAFALGRGLTLVIATLTGIGIWYALTLILQPLLNRVGNQVDRKVRRSRERVISYLYRAFTVLVIVIGVLVVFYLRSDTLLLALAILAIGFAAVGLRHLAPKYMRELRLLLDIGSVREGERLTYQGLPMQVRTINTFAILRNPALTGVVRLPLSELTGLVSRPVGDEPWFPCESGDVVLLPDGTLGTVTFQTLDSVGIRTGPSSVNHATSEIINLPLKNLSRDGFTQTTTFGIDYQHQSIALEVAEQMKDAVSARLEASAHAESVENVSVDFKEAAADSLNYIVFVRMSGDAANSYYAIGRLVQQALVDLCNVQGWIIPFSQLTIHAGEGIGNTAVRSEISP